MIFGDDYLTVHSLVNMESKCVGISKVYHHIVYEIKSFECFFIFLTERNNNVMT